MTTGIKRLTEEEYSKYLSIDDLVFETIFKSIYNLLFQYTKDFKDPKSWVGYYSKLINTKFPQITFNEGYDAFVEKVTKILDLMELTHLYCKVVSPHLYVKEHHASIVSTKGYLVKELEKISDLHFKELMQHLKYSIMFGNN